MPSAGVVRDQLVQRLRRRRCAATASAPYSTKLPGSHEVVDVLARRALAGLAPARHRVGPRGVEGQRVARAAPRRGRGGSRRGRPRPPSSAAFASTSAGSMNSSGWPSETRVARAPRRPARTMPPRRRGDRRAPSSSLPSRRAAGRRGPASPSATSNADDRALQRRARTATGCPAARRRQRPVDARRRPARRSPQTRASTYGCAIAAGSRPARAHVVVERSAVVRPRPPRHVRVRAAAPQEADVGRRRPRCGTPPARAGAARDGVGEVAATACARSPWRAASRSSGLVR